MESPESKKRSADGAAPKLPTTPDRPREDVVRDVMELLEQLEASFNQLQSPENGELVDFVNILRCRLGQPGPRLVGANKEKR